MLTQITVDDVMGWGPCYSREMIERVADGRQAMTPMEIVDLDVKISDRLWVLLRPEIIPAAQLHELGCIFAERTLLREGEAGREPHADLWRALLVKRA